MKTHVIFFLLNLWSLSLIAQETEYHSLGKPLKKQNQTSNYSDNNLSLKVDLWDILLGNYGLFIEKNVNQKFGIEVGAGLTKSTQINNFFMFETGTQGPFGVKPISASNPLILDYYNPEFSVARELDIESKTGYFLTLFPKYYFDDDPNSGYILGVKVIYQNYKFNSEYVSSISRFSVTGNFGHKYDFGDSRFILENTMGLGLAFVNDKRNVVVRDNSNNEIGGQVRFSPSRIHLNIGVKMSYNFGE